MLLSGGRAVNLESGADSSEGLASPQDYLEKIFQVPFQLQRMEEKGFSSLVTQLLPVTTPDLRPSAAIPETKPVIAVETVVKPLEQTPRSIEETPKAEVNPEPRPTPPPIAETLPVAPERLRLEEWEQAAVKECHPLFRTPRAVKRLANTYCLIRVGVEATAWQEFLGSAKNPVAEYRTPLLMLAVAAAYPALARHWLRGIEKNETWTPAAESNALDKNSQKVDHSDWDELTAALEHMNADKFSPFDIVQVRKWQPKVKRYSF